MKNSAEPPRSARVAKRPFARNKKYQKRVSLEENQSREAKGGPVVVKGISKRVIVVQSPDPKIFEQAIFIVREDFAGQTGVSEKELLRQARQAANSYLRGGGSLQGKVLPALRGMMYAVAGAAATALAWVMVAMARL